MKKINPIVRWWVTPKLPEHDVYELPLLKNKNIIAKTVHLASRWLIHPIKRRLARWYLRFLQTFTGIKVIGITGSAGKSTTTTMIASILKTKAQTVVTPPSIDPVYNIPNTILRCSPFTKYLVLEMSVEYPGEMDYYLWLAKPDIGVITNIMPSHLEYLKSVDGVLQEKGKLIKSLSKDGVAVLNSEDLKLKEYIHNLPAKTVWFNGKGDILEQNRAAASTTARVLGINTDRVNKGIASYVSPDHRLRTIKLANGAVIIDDTYNSNPGAAIAAIKYFNKIAKGRKFAILGDMLELGSYEEEGHRKVGVETAKSGFEVVIGVGRACKYLIDEINKNSKDTKTYMVSDWEKALDLVSPLLSKDTYTLVKGSRSLGLDHLVDKLS